MIVIDTIKRDIEREERLQLIKSSRNLEGLFRFGADAVRVEEEEERGGLLRWHKIYCPRSGPVKANRFIPQRRHADLSSSQTPPHKMSISDPDLHWSRGHDETPFRYEGTNLWTAQKVHQDAMRTASAAVASFPNDEESHRNDLESAEAQGRLSLEDQFLDETLATHRRERQRKEAEAVSEATAREARSFVAGMTIKSVIEQAVVHGHGGTEPRDDDVGSQRATMHATFGEMNVTVVSGDDCEETTRGRGYLPALDSPEVAKDLSVHYSTKTMERIMTDRDNLLVHRVGEQLSMEPLVRMRGSLELAWMVDKEFRKLHAELGVESWRASGLQILAEAMRFVKPLSLPSSPPKTETPTASSHPNGPRQSKPDDSSVHDAVPEVGIAAKEEYAQSLPPPHPVELKALNTVVSCLLDAPQLVVPPRNALDDLFESVPLASEGSANKDIFFYSSRLSAGVTRPFLDFLWRTSTFTTLEEELALLPVRWTPYQSVQEFVEEEISELLLREKMARQKIIQEQIELFLLLVKRTV